MTATSAPQSAPTLPDDAPSAADFWDDFTDRERAAMRQVLYHAGMVAAVIGDGSLGEVDDVSEHLYGELECLAWVAVLFVQTVRECFGTPPNRRRRRRTAAPRRVRPHPAPGGRPPADGRQAGRVFPPALARATKYEGRKFRSRDCKDCGVRQG